MTAGRRSTFQPAQPDVAISVAYLRLVDLACVPLQRCGVAGVPCQRKGHLNRWLSWRSRPALAYRGDRDD